MKLDIDTIKDGMSCLTRLKHNNLIGIVDHLSNGDYRLKPNIIPNSGGVYGFWWTGTLSDFINKKVNRVISFKGPNGRIVEIEFTDEWIQEIQVNGNIPLYVGKTADSLKNRLGLHLQLKTRRGLSMGINALSEDRKTSSNQMRDRIERMFLEEPDSRNLILHNVGLSYVVLDGDLESANRFYLEDRAIGEFLPLFNIDIER